MQTHVHEPMISAGEVSRPQYRQVTNIIIFKPRGKDGINALGLAKKLIESKGLHVEKRSDAGGFGLKEAHVEKPKGDGLAVNELHSELKRSGLKVRFTESS